MLNQLGNLHEAGQQLAEARERAAKAETEALFLRERLAEMRQQEAPSAAEQSSAASPPPSGGDETDKGASVSSPLGGRGVRDRNTAEGDQSSDLGPLAGAERSEAEGASSSGPVAVPVRQLEVAQALNRDVSQRSLRIRHRRGGVGNWRDRHPWRTDRRNGSLDAGHHAGSWLPRCSSPGCCCCEACAASIGRTSTSVR